MVLYRKDQILMHIAMHYDKQKIIAIVLKELKNRVHSLHIAAIINLLLEELSKDLLSGKDVRIGNFGTLMLKTIGSKKNVDVVSGEMRQTKRTKALRFKLSKNFIEINRSKDEEVIS